MRSIVETLIRAARQHKRQVSRLTLDRISEETQISLRTLKRLFSGRISEGRIPYVTVVAVLTALHCSVAEFEALRANRSQLNLITKHYKTWRNDRKERVARRLRTATEFCSELGEDVTVTQCHDCWVELHDEGWRLKYGTRRRCREAHITRRDRNDR